MRTCRRSLKYLGYWLKGEIHAGANHTEVVIRPIHKIPAEIAHPADVRRKPNFKATADLTNSSTFGACMTGRLNNVEAFSWFNKSLVNALLPPAKYPASTTENVRGEPRARDWITERQRAQHRANRVVLTGEAP